MRSTSLKVFCGVVGVHSATVLQAVRKGRQSCEGLLLIVFAERDYMSATQIVFSEQGSKIAGVKITEVINRGALFAKAAADDLCDAPMMQVDTGSKNCQVQLRSLKFLSTPPFLAPAHQVLTSCC